MKGLKKIFIFLLILFIIVGGYFCFLSAPKRNTFDSHRVSKQSVELGNWVEYTSENQDFVVHLPQHPEIIAKEFPIPRSTNTLPYREYKSQIDEESNLSISFTTIPEEWLKWSPGLILKGALKVIMQERREAHLVGKSSNTFKGFPALDYEHYLGEMETVGTLILAGEKLYKLEITYPTTKRDAIQESISHFINSCIFSNASFGSTPD